MLDTAFLPTCHDGPEHGLGEIMRRHGEDRAAAERVLLGAMAEPGATMALDDALALLEDVCERPYDMVSACVRKGLLVVEFEATPRPFPFRSILVRRL